MWGGGHPASPAPRLRSNGRSKRSGCAGAGRTATTSPGASCAQRASHQPRRAADSAIRALVWAATCRWSLAARAATTPMAGGLGQRRRSGAGRQRGSSARRQCSSASCSAPRVCHASCGSGSAAPASRTAGSSPAGSSSGAATAALTAHTSAKMRRSRCRVGLSATPDSNAASASASAVSTATRASCTSVTAADPPRRWRSDAAQTDCPRESLACQLCQPPARARTTRAHPPRAADHFA